MASLDRAAIGGEKLFNLDCARVSVLMNLMIGITSQLVGGRLNCPPN